MLRQLGDTDVVRKLSDDLNASDLATLLLEVAASRASRVRAPAALARYRSDRFSQPGAPTFGDLRAIEDRFMSAVPTHWRWVVTSPLLPLGTHSAIGEVPQDWVVATVRGNEVAADPTVGLALEAAVARAESTRRRADEPVRLATIQRITRAQLYESPLAYPHFTIFALVTAGRSRAREGFDDEALLEHVGIYVEALDEVSERVEIVLSVARTPYGARLLGAAHDRWTSRVSEDAERLGSQRYYTRACFKIHAVIAGALYEIADGGFTDWTQRLLDDRHERMLISGCGLDRPAIAIGRGDVR